MDSFMDCLIHEQGMCGSSFPMFRLSFVSGRGILHDKTHASGQICELFIFLTCSLSFMRADVSLPDSSVTQGRGIRKRFPWDWN